MTAEQVLLDIRRQIDAYLSQTQQPAQPQQPQPVPQPPVTQPPFSPVNVKILQANPGRTDVLLGPDEIAALSFKPFNNNITISKGKAGMGTPSKIVYNISDQPGSFIPLANVLYGHGESDIFSFTIRIADNPFRYGSAVLEKGQTYYLNIRFIDSPADAGCMVDIPWNVYG